MSGVAFAKARMMCFRRQSQLGFSLIEVIVTLTILGLLMSIVTVNLRGANVRNAMKAELGELALLIEDVRTVSLYANRELSIATYLTDFSSSPDHDFYLSITALTEESSQRRINLSQKLRLQEDIIIIPPGACQQGQGELRLSNGRVVQFSVAPLTCNVLLS